MRTLIFLLLLSVSAYSQNALVHINAEFNKSNDWYGVDVISNAKVYNGYVDNNPAIKDKYSIVRVPTLILFKDGDEVYRWEGGLDMKLNIKVNEVQNKIDNK
ncbi:MAG: thioredoxin family protein [bacterium]|nr:thioredoxin family protein [bacterium]